MDSLCDAIFSGILSALQITVNYRRCYISLSLGDQDRNTQLTREEFPKYANLASGQKYGSSVPFGDLPVPMQLIFDDFAQAGIIDITGAQSGTQPTAEREPILQSLCKQTLVAVEAGDNVSTPAPTESPGKIVLDSRYCITAMAASDLNRDSQMDSDDYARFINTVSGNGYPARQFDLLPQILQDNFISNANALGVFDILGSWPGQPRSSEQEANLQRFCAATEVALNKQTNAPPPPPTLAPTRGEVQAFPYIQCTLSMFTSDSDRSNTLLEEEYVLFVNKVSLYSWKDSVYADLPKPLQTNYEALSAESTTPGIDVTGSFPGKTPEPAQKTFLERICYDTAVAVDAALYPKGTSAPTIAPAIAPGGSDDQAFTGNITIYNAFFVSNAPGASVEDLLSEGGLAESRTIIQTAYANFVTDIVSDFMATRSRWRRLLRGLAVNGVVQGSQQIYAYETTECPQTSTQQVCAKAYGTFDIDVERERDPDTLEKELTSAIQTALNQTDGGMQPYIQEAEPEAPIIMDGAPANDGLRPISQAPVAAPTQPPSPPDDRSGGDDGGGLGIAAIIGIVVGGLVLCCCCAYCIYASDGDLLGCLQDRGPPKKKKRTETEASVNQFDDDLPPPPALAGDLGDVNSTPQRRSMLGGALGLFEKDKEKGSPKTTDEESAGGFSIQEQSPQRGSRFGALGFGKKNANKGLPTSPMHGDQESVADYGFDDATLDQSKAGDDDDTRNEPSLTSGDWNPHQPGFSGDPWSDRRRESDSSGSDDDGTGYGTESGSESRSDSRSGSGSGSRSDSGSGEDSYGEERDGGMDGYNDEDR